MSRGLLRVETYSILDSWSKPSICNSLHALCVACICDIAVDRRPCYGESDVTFPRLRLRSFYRVAALLLLFLTGLDLSMDVGSVTFCAIDAERTHAVPPSENGLGNPTSHSQQSQSPHIDDCFCCSACVNVTPVAQPLNVTLVAATPLPVVPRQLPLLSRFLFHPPQLLS